MGIFDIFTNNAAEEATNRNRALYQGYGTQANDALTGYGTQAGNIFANYGQQGQGILNTGYAQGRQDLTDAIGSYAPLSALGSKYGGATDLYLGALGARGPEGQAAARAAFQTGPGYQFAVDQATDAAARNAAKLGLAGSGNALDEIRSRAQNFANQEYGGYLDRLAGFVNPELSATSGATSGRAQGYTNLANLAQTDATSRLGLLGNASAAQAQLLKDIAEGRIGIGSNVTSGLASANNAEAQAAQQGSANFWNALANIGSAGIRGFFGQPRAA